MATLTDAELEVLLADTESDRVERKAAWAGDAPEKSRQAVCAFANDLPGHGQPFDTHPIAGSSLSDLSRSSFENEYLPRATLAVAVDYTSGSTVEERRSAYPLVALQQLARNAVMHRSYENTHAPARVYWFDDRIEIINPGGPYGAVTQANFGMAGFADYRNPNIATALKTLGFVQRFGFGIADARRALRENGNPPPEFDVQPESVRVTLRRAP
jgi:predicted HTH transcriptional regulator